MDCEDAIAWSVAIKTNDHLLGGRVRLTQPEDGYRVAIDPVLLAASIAVGQGERVLDAGCGTGAAALCLAARIPDFPIVGVELNGELAALARANVSANGLDGRVTIAESSLEAYAVENAGTFDQVITNPPFYAEGRHTRSPVGSKATAHGEQDLPLDDWVKAAAVALRAGGRLTLIHRADRLDELFSALGRRFGAAIIFPLWPRTGSEAKRVLLTAVKGRRTSPALMPGLVLHESDGAYTAAVQAILRDAAALDLGSGSA
jgi:tRNA1(Val) A37 N6-methylase TrmN6